MKLDNGLTAILIEDHSQPLVSVQVWVKAGSINENTKTYGLSHFLEHLIFKGSKNYPGDEMTRKTETNGGSINAATSKEYTQYHIDIQKDGLEESIRMLADVMFEASFPADEIKKERPVVLEEISRHDDNPDAVLFDMFNEALFAKSPYRWNIIGSSEVIRNVSRDEIIAYYKNYYTPANMTVCVAGDFSKDKAMNLIKETFGSRNNTGTEANPDLTEPFHSPVEKRLAKNVEQVYWLGGFIGPDIKSDDQFAGDIASTILGGVRSSRLHQNIREKKKLVYSIGCSFWSQRGSGIFAVNSIFKPENEGEFVKELYHEIDEFSANGPSQDELKRAKAILKSQWYFGRETCHERAATAGYWQTQGNPAMPDRYIQGIEKVTKEDVTAFMKKYYVPQKLNSSVIFPGKQ